MHNDYYYSIKNKNDIIIIIMTEWTIAKYLSELFIWKNFQRI